MRGASFGFLEFLKPPSLPKIAITWRGARPGVVGAPAVGMVRVLAVAAVVTPVVRDVSRRRAFFRRAAFHCFFRFEERDRHCGG